MKLQNATKFQKGIFAATLLGLVSLTGAATVSGDTIAQPASNAIVANGAKLSPSAREIVKMVTSGVPEDTIKAYVETYPSMYNLTPDNIINMQGVGVSSAVMTEMLNHDKALRDNANAYAATVNQPQQPMPQLAPYPTTAQAPDDSTYASAPDDSADYNGLSPYGTWNNVAGYGWCWQPYSWLGYNYYPWGLLGGGGWFNCPGRGWCWFPNSRFNRFGQFGRFNNFNRFGGFAGNRFNAGFRPGVGVGFNRSFNVNRSFAVNRSASGFRGFSPAMGHFSGGRVGGGFSVSRGGGGFSGGHGGGGGSGHR